VLTRRPNTIPRHKSRKARIGTGTARYGGNAEWKETPLAASNGQSGEETPKRAMTGHHHRLLGDFATIECVRACRHDALVPGPALVR
jgi:hypothetical protein